MKYGVIIISLLLSLFLEPTKAQDNNIVGSWKGKLDAMGTKLTIIFNVEEKSGKYVAALDSPDQGAYGIAVSSINLKPKKLILNVALIGGTYEGNFINNDSLSGKWKQNGMEFDLDLKKEFLNKEKVNGKQDG